MKLSPFYMEIWSFETIHRLNFNTQHQKHHDVTNDVKVTFLICRFVGCMKNMPILANILFYHSKNNEHVCNGIRRKIDIDSVLSTVCMIANERPYFKNSDCC